MPTNEEIVKTIEPTAAVYEVRHRGRPSGYRVCRERADHSLSRIGPERETKEAAWAAAAERLATGRG